MNQHDMTRNMVLAALFAALTAIGAFLQIPTGTVPITLQFLFTALAGLLLGWKWGAISQLLYVGIGLLGLPAFTQGGGTFICSPPRPFPRCWRPCWCMCLATR